MTVTREAIKEHWVFTPNAKRLGEKHGLDLVEIAHVLINDDEYFQHGYVINNVTFYVTQTGKIGAKVIE